MNTHPSSSRTSSHRFGFTLVEVLVVITIIGILAGLLTVAVGRVLVRSQEFAIQTEMSQLESAITQFETQYGFYPPSFKRIEQISGPNNSNPVDAANEVLKFISRIAPNNAESLVVPNVSIPNVNPVRRVDIWWNEVGQFIGDANNNPGADLVFWLSGLAKNKQFPLTSIDVNGNVFGLPAHNYFEDDTIEREEIFEFDKTRIIPNANANNRVVSYIQPVGNNVPYVYRNAGINYIPNNPSDMTAMDGAYVNPTWNNIFTGAQERVTIQQVIDAAFHLDPELVENDISGDLSGSNNPGLASKQIFDQIFPNADSFQLISFGVDGEPGGPGAGSNLNNPNIFTNAAIQDAADNKVKGIDNMVNFGPSGASKLENLILDLN